MKMELRVNNRNHLNASMMLLGKMYQVVATDSNIPIGAILSPKSNGEVVMITADENNNVNIAVTFLNAAAKNSLVIPFEGSVILQNG